MKIAIVAPAEEQVPPRRYGGTELVVAILANELVAMGHDVTLFASGDSQTKARLVPVAPAATRALQSARDPDIRAALNYEALAQTIEHLQGEQFDVIHNHTSWQFFLFHALFKAPILTTCHMGFTNGAERYMYEKYRSLSFVSISNAQRKLLPSLNYLATAYHGLPLDQYPFEVHPQENYLMFLGRFAPEKNPEGAINIAKRTGKKLVMAAKIDATDQDFFDTKVLPHIDNQQIVYVGEVAHDEKVKLLKNASALLSPITWEEPFGLVNAEAMACGTPVIATRRGSLPELVEDGKTGFICDSLDEMCERVNELGKLRRQDCRLRVEEHFSAQAMARSYTQLYERLLAS